MAREGGVLADGDVESAIYPDSSEMDISAMILRCMMWIREHGISTNVQLGHNMKYIFPGSGNANVSTAANCPKSCFDWINVSQYYLAPPPASVLDDFDDASVNGTTWASYTNIISGVSGGAATITESGAYPVGNVICYAGGGGSPASGGRAQLTCKTNWGTGGTTVTYFRICLNTISASGGLSTAYVQFSSTTADTGGTQVNIVTYTDGAGCWDFIINGATLYRWKNGVAQSNVDITGYTATRYLRFYSDIAANGGGYLTSTVKAYSVSYGLPGSNISYTNVGYFQTGNTATIRSIVAVGQAYSPFSGSTSDVIMYQGSTDNGSNWYAKAYGIQATLPTTDIATCIFPPYLFTPTITSTQAVLKFKFDWNSSATSVSYSLVQRLALMYRE